MSCNESMLHKCVAMLCAALVYTQGRGALILDEEF